jgi:hypothetical protein
MLKGMIEKILSLAEIERFQVGGRDYTSQTIHPVSEPMPFSLGINTLTGFVDFFKGCKDDSGEDAIVHIESHEQVSLRSPLVGSFCQRKTFLVAKALPYPFPFGQYVALEEFIIALQSRFVDNDDVGKILKVVGNLEDSNVRRYTDDGVSQGVVAKVGIAKVENVPVPRIVKLAPFRTFLEIEQPKSSFLLRMRPGEDGSPPSCALFEADGGKWKNEAVRAIKAYFVKQLPAKTVILA